jgi:hypothetical protein
MTTCNHTALELLPVRKRTMRCRHCHLTIDGEELGDSCCPECLERSGKRLYEFEALETINDSGVTYRCEECGAIIKIP